jgi:hypothetical protein
MMTTLTSVEITAQSGGTRSVQVGDSVYFDCMGTQQGRIDRFMVDHNNRPLLVLTHPTGFTGPAGSGKNGEFIVWAKNAWVV